MSGDIVEHEVIHPSRIRTHLQTSWLSVCLYWNYAHKVLAITTKPNAQNRLLEKNAYVCTAVCTNVEERKKVSSHLLNKSGGT